MSEDPRDELIVDAIRAFNELDAEALIAFIHPEVKARVGESMGNPGTYEGIEGFGAMMADWGEAWASQRITLNRIEHLDEVTTFVHVRQALIGAGSGISVEADMVFLIVMADQQAIRFEIHSDRDAAASSL